MNGVSKIDKLEESISGGGITSKTLSLMGGLIRCFHFLTSGIWLKSIRRVFNVAVAVIKRKHPDIPDSSPDVKLIAGRKAFLDFLPSPQLMTEKELQLGCVSILM